MAVVVVSDPIVIPASGDWTDQGEVMANGGASAWDRYLFGMMTPSSIVYFDNKYFMYYIGGDTVTGAGGDARNRKIGVATSTDRVNWTKYGSNPIIDEVDVADDETGSSGLVALIDGSEIVIYYNKLIDVGPGSVDSDLWVADSSDGFTFSNHTEVMTGASRSGYSGEIWPNGVIRDGSTTYIYYSGDSWNISMLTLSARATISVAETAVLSVGPNIILAQTVALDDENYAVFLPEQSFGDPWTTGVRTTTKSAPSTFSAEQYTYSLTGQGSQQTYYFDLISNQWLMFYQTNPADTDNTDIGLMTAPRN